MFNVKRSFLTVPVQDRRRLQAGDRVRLLLRRDALLRRRSGVQREAEGHQGGHRGCHLREEVRSFVSSFIKTRERLSEHFAQLFLSLCKYVISIGFLEMLEYKVARLAIWHWQYCKHNHST